MTYILFGLYASVITAAAGAVCGIIYQEVIINGK